jgi:hypothetical protein
MNEDYLWDKTGEPDPEIQQLEEILGTLRYQPRPLELPDDLPAPRRWNYFPVLAIAASLLLALLAAGIWLQTRTRRESLPRQATNVPAPAVPESPETPGTETPKEPSAVKEPDVPERRVAVDNKRRNRSSASLLTKREREEALEAKEQVMLALRLASEKLNLAHRKTQPAAPANQIKNQHRVG